MIVSGFGEMLSTWIPHYNRITFARWQHSSVRLFLWHSRGGSTVRSLVSR